MIYLINYSDLKFKNSQKENSVSGLKMGFDKTISYNRNDLDINFQKEYSHILKHSRGAGYWIWKPYIILKTLKSIPEKDIVFYCDSGADFINPINEIIEIFKSRCLDGIMGFTLLNLEYEWTKRDSFILMDLDYKEYTHTLQHIGGYSIWKNTPTSIQFLQEWLLYGKDERIITDIPSKNSNYEGFKEHRHDQSIFSLLYKKYKLPLFKDPSQYGENQQYLDDRVFLNFKTIINSHRNSN